MKYLILLIILISCSPSQDSVDFNICNNKEILVQRIINGNETTSFPEVGVFSSAFPEENRDCTAILIGKKTLLTVRHCISDNITQSYVILGDGLKRYLSSAIKHPKTDIGLLFLNEEVESVKPVKLSYSAPISGDTILLLGYGRINSDPDQEILPKKLVYGCNTILEVLDDSFNFNLDSGRSDICYGDSGGPTYMDGILIGIHSYITYEIEGECGNGTSFDVRVDMYLNWILENIKNDTISIVKYRFFKEKK